MITLVVSYSTALERMVAYEEHHSGHQWTLRPRQHDYALGKKPPNYLVPAIRQGFEWGRELQTGEVTLLHWYQGAYG